MAQGLVVVGVSGGIAAYKAAELVSRLVQEGHPVQVVMTEAACRFITPLTLATISGRPVYEGIFAEEPAGRVSHVELAREAALIVVAPATAQTIARLAHGLADDAIAATVLATRAPVVVAPAMNAQMYSHPATQANLARLRELGYTIVEPESGWLACREEGAGRLASTERLLAEVRRQLQRRRDLAGLTVLVTAGGTREAIDPVRYIGNRSSGKMGYALAEAARRRGARVILVSAPTALPPPAGVELVPVESAAQMREAVLRAFAECQVVIKAAAVADYRPAAARAQKIKKREGVFHLELEPTPDILAELGRQKGARVLVGFAAETEALRPNALHKLNAKNLDLVVANDVSRAGAGFGCDTNIVTLFFRDGRVEELPCLPKSEVADRILDAVAGLLAAGDAALS